MLSSELPTWFVRVFAFAFGALWGSFANVVIYRWPREMSVAFPASHCFACKKPVRPYDNVPILAWLWLRGRCRDCGAKFSPRYPLVELLFAVVSLAIAERAFFHAPASTAAWVSLAHYGARFCVAFALMVATFIDLDEMLVPWFIKWFTPVPLLAAALLPGMEPSVGVAQSLIGAAIGYLGLRVLFIDGYKVLTGRAGMGLGDAEILLLVGALLGPWGVAFALGAGAVQGLVAAVVVMALGHRLGPEHADEIEDEDDEDEGDESAANDEGDAGSEGEDAGGGEGSEDAVLVEGGKGMKTKVPFVPFLALASLEYLLGADAVVEAYLRWMRGY